MKTTIIIFILTFNLCVRGQEVICVIPNDTTCGRKIDTKSNNYYYSLPDQPAEFLGGMSALMKYFHENLVLPKDTCDYNTIKLVMTVFSDGTPTFTMLGAPKNCINLETEIKRLISEMPKWKPAKCKGQLVDHRFYIPIHINLK